MSTARPTPAGADAGSVESGPGKMTSVELQVWAWALAAAVKPTKASAKREPNRFLCCIKSSNYDDSGLVSYVCSVLWLRWCNRTGGQNLSRRMKRNVKGVGAHDSPVGYHRRRGVNPPAAGQKTKAWALRLTSAARSLNNQASRRKFEMSFWRPQKPLRGLRCHGDRQKHIGSDER